MKIFFILVVFCTASITAASQVCFLGGGGSGASTNEILFCSNIVWYTSSEKNSGFSFNSIYYCADIARFTSSEKGSGQDSAAIAYCKINSQNQVFHSSASGFSGYSLNKINYCTSGHLEGGKSALGYNSIAYCTTITFNGSSGSGYNKAINLCLNPLPVELLSFQAIKSNNQALLLWSTGTEINNSHFLIERSTDGLSFSPLGIRQGAGNSNNITYYNFTDSTPVSGINYYRLCQFDFDGTPTFGPERALDFSNDEKPGDLFCFPNPASQGEDINIFIPAGSNTLLCLFDLNGRLIFSQKSESENETLIQINASAFSTGVYIIRLQNDRLTLEGKLMIQ